MPYKIVSQKMFSEFLTNGRFDLKKFSSLSLAQKNLIILRAYQHSKKVYKSRSESAKKRWAEQRQ